MPHDPRCIICGSREAHIVESCDDPYAVLRCVECGLIFVHPHPPALDSHYDREYYREWIEHQMPSRLAMWRKRLRGMKRFQPGGRLLDVGCGNGTFLSLARESGFDVAGTEVSSYACEHIQKKFGIDVYNGSLTGATFAPASFETITMWHTLEHMPDPLENLRAAHRLLVAKGLLVVAVPNVGNTLMRLIYPLVRGKKLRLFTPGDREVHLFHFSQATLGRILETAGFRTVRMEPDLSQVVRSKKPIDWISGAVHAVCRRNIGEGIKAYAVKRGDA